MYPSAVTYPFPRDPQLRLGVFFIGNYLIFNVMGDILGDTLSMTRGQIGDKSGTNPYFTDILTMGGHTQMGSTPIISTK